MTGGESFLAAVVSVGRVAQLVECGDPLSFPT